MGEGKDRLVVAINGGPRKGWNTDMLLQRALDGAKEAGAETLCVDLYSVDYKGCTSCFGCKREGRYRLGKCFMKDGLSPILETLEGATGVVVGSPIYIGDVTGALRSFIERYIFMNVVYSLDEPPVLERGPGVGLIYTMNVKPDLAERFGYLRMVKLHKRFFGRLSPPFVEEVVSFDTYQFNNYADFHAPIFDAAHKKRMREESFPKDLEKAYELGLRLGALEEKPRILKYPAAASGA
jgi:multimeric flavodoxin WrbA